MLPANSVVRIEPMRLAMNASHRVCAPLRCDDGLAAIYITWEALSAGSRRTNSGTSTLRAAWVATPLVKADSAKWRPLIKKYPGVVP
jgi:hypothetical protein